jgi:hypothetical protein
MNPQLPDAEAESMLKEAKHIWNDEHRGYMRARRKGRSPANDRRNEPDVISEEGLSDHGLTYPDALPKERRAALDWLAERIREGDRGTMSEPNAGAQASTP